MKGLSGRTTGLRMRRASSATASVALALLGMTALAAPARGDSSPAAGTPATVTADALPTWQINGVAWSQVVVGETVYVAGSFTEARPPGVAVGGPGAVPESNLLAYDITTGNLITSFSHSLNAQALAVAASPDGSKVFVGGDFTTVDGLNRGHVAAFSTATGALLPPLSPGVDGEVKALTVSQSTLYVGGSFTAVGGISRGFGAAYDLATSKLAGWDPGASTTIWAMTMAPDQSRVVLGGNFSTLGGQTRYGLGAVDATTGTPTQWVANQVIRDYGNNAAITSLTNDGTQIIGTGYAYGTGNYEGRFSIDATGNVNWLNDCHGDGYSTAVVGTVVYSVGHSHNCANIGQFPETNPRTFHRALAESTAPSCTVLTNSQTGGNYANFAGYPCTQQFDWYPTVTPGTYTGQSQGAWSVAANSSYVVLGGEFPSVNGTAQQGLVRFAVSSIAPNKVGPKADSTLTPRVISLQPGTAHLTWQTQWDMDNESLTYKVYRSDVSGPVYTAQANSRFYQLSPLTWTDTGLTPGATYQYQVRVIDPFGNSVYGSKVAVTVASTAAGSYVSDVVNDGAYDYWRLDQATGATTTPDFVGVRDLAVGSGVTGGGSGAINGDADPSSAFNGTSSGLATTQVGAPGPNVFSIEAWFKTTATSGKIIGYGNLKSGNSTSDDRHIYLDSSGRLNFGVYNLAQYKITTAGAGYNDGQWHQVVGTLSSAGMAFYVDGRLVGTNTGTTTGQPYGGYWRIGGDSTWSGTAYLNGSIDDVAIYPTALSLTQVKAHYIDSGRVIVGATAPADPYGATVWNDSPSAYYRLDETGGTTATDLSGNMDNGRYSGTETFGVPSTVTGPSGTGVTFPGSTKSSLGSGTARSAPSVYSEEAWFKTTTTLGGELIGFGNRQSGSSTVVDRLVYLATNGQLNFQVSGGGRTTIASPGRYNDGKWHQVVATQAADGMALYVDGVAVASNPQAGQTSMTGYWRVGGDTGGGGVSGFAGTMDEVAIYGGELTAAQVASHYKASFVYNHAPTAAFTSSTHFLTASFDASGSTDSDGSVVSYAWDFGDGASASGVTASHVYAAAGTYPVTLTVTDNGGASATKTGSVTVAANVAPTASFTSSASGLTVSVDGSGSSDSDGSVASYAWDFGDGAAGSGVTASHTYAASGTYTVTLTVTDDQGATGSTTATVTVSSVVVLASDDFNRTVVGGLGSADTGGAWTLTGSATNYAVSNGSATITLKSAGSGPQAYLGAVSSLNTDTSVSLTTDKAGVGTNGIDLSLVGRRVGTSDYSAKVRLLPLGVVRLGIYRTDSTGTQTAVVPEAIVSGLTYNPGDVLTVRFQVTGSNATVLKAKVWNAAQTAEPDWIATGNDSTAALQAAGSIGLKPYLSGQATNAPVVVTYSRLRCYDATTLP